MSAPAAQSHWRPASFEGFAFERLLSQDPVTGSVAILGSFAGQEGQAVVRLSRQRFDATQLQKMLGPGVVMKKTDFENDIYSKFSAQLPTELALVNVDLVHPCTEKHIKKAEEQEVHMVRETAEDFKQRILPYIASIPASRLLWVYNILEHKAEAERLIFEDPDPVNGFMLLPDLKWDQMAMQQLYCLAICHRRDVACLRSLNSEHLPLLRNIRQQVAAEAQRRYGVAPGQLRMFLHYPPSYYHLHVHVVHVKACYGLGAAVGKAHLLDDIIDNIEGFGADYYQKRTLSVAIGTNDEMWALMQATASALKEAEADPPAKKQCN